MSVNKGYLTAKRTSESDELYTPQYAVKPILKYLKPNSHVWCPFDKKNSNFVKLLSEAGHKVGYSHIDAGYDFDFFTLAKKIINKGESNTDYIISNPPFSQKDKVLKVLHELNIPYAVIMPLPVLQGQKRFDYIKDCEALVFDKRINYFKDENMKEMAKGVSFASIYLCRGILPEKLIFEKLEVD